MGYSGTCLNPLAKKKVMGELTYRFGFVGSSPPSTWSQARLNRSSTMRRTCRSSHLETLRSAAFRGRFIPFVAKNQGERGRPNYIDYILYIYIYVPCTRITWLRHSESIMQLGIPSEILSYCVPVGRKKQLLIADASTQGFPEFHYKRFWGATLPNGAIYNLHEQTWNFG